MFALVDCNNFYVSCETLFNPSLKGKPVCVLSNNDGCVISRSQEAKDLGIPMGAVLFEWQAFMEKNNVQLYSANFELYGDMSNRVMRIISKYSPNVEIYSIDEMFLDLRGINQEALQERAQALREEIYRCTGIPTCVGIAPSKALAKLANRIAKKYPQCHGVHLIDDEVKRIKAIRWLKIEDVWGIGKQSARKLKEANIHTAFDFTQASDTFARNMLSVVGLRLKHDLEGKANIQMEDPKVRKAIASTRSFDKMIDNLDGLQERITTFAVACAEKLRQQGSECQCIEIFLRTNKHRLDQDQYNPTFKYPLPYATNSSLELTKFAMHALDVIYRKGYQYKKAGVIVEQLSPVDEHQSQLFEDSDERHRGLMDSLDFINKKYGKGTLKLAIQDKKMMHKMNRNYLSPRYSTRIDEIITVKV